MENIKGKDLIVEIFSVKPNTWNPKDSINDNPDNKKKYEEIKKEIQNKGLFEAITVREVVEEDGMYEILDGFHRWMACKELGFTKIRINNLGVINNSLAKAITLVKEQKKVSLSELKVADLIQVLQEEVGGDMEALSDLVGLSEEELNDYIKMAEFDWDNFNKEHENDGAEDDKDNLTIEITFDSLDDKAKFIQEAKTIIVKCNGVLE